MSAIIPINSTNAKSFRVGNKIHEPRVKLDMLDKKGKLDANIKQDTTYYNNPLYKMIDKYFKVNPVYEDPILEQFGELDVTGMSPMEKYIQYEAVVAKSNGIVADDLVFTHGDSQVYPCLRKSKFFQYGVFLPELKKKALDSGGMGGNMIAAQVEAEIQASKGFMLENLLKWMLHYQALTSEVDYDPDWSGFLYAQSTGTASIPESIAATPQTATALAQNFTGSSNKSVDFIANTFGVTQYNFRAQRDSTTGEQMLNGSLGRNTFLWLLNPDNVNRLEQFHPNNGVQDDQNITYGDQIRKLPGTHKILGSYDVDAAASVAEDGTNIVVCMVNPKENFKIAYQVPFIEEGWREAWSGGQFGYIKRAYMKVAPWVRPWYINGEWRKGMDHFTYVYMNEAG